MKLPKSEREKLKHADIRAYQPALDTLSSHAVIQNLAPSTRTNYLSNAKRFFAYLTVYRKGVPMEEVTYEDCRAFVLYHVQYGMEPRTINTYISTMVKLFYCVRHDRFNNCEVPYQKTEKHLPSVITTSVFTALYAVCESSFEKALICFLFCTGMRISELLACRFCDINRAELKVYVGPSKGRHDRYTLLSEKALQVLEGFYRDLYGFHTKASSDWYVFAKQAPDGNYMPITYYDARKVMLRLTEKANLQGKGYTLHSFRHGFATELYRNTNNLVLLAELLGHRSLNATRIYVELAAIDYVHDNHISNPLDSVVFEI